MNMPNRSHVPLLLLALLVVGALAVPFAAHSDDGYATDGYLAETSDGDCLTLRDHDGHVLVLTGAVDGLEGDDHVRLWGRNVRGADCGDRRGNAYEVTEVLTLWANDRHTETYYDHETDGSFKAWVRRNRGD